MTSSPGEPAHGFASTDRPSRAQNPGASTVGFGASLRESGLTPRAQMGRVLAGGAATVMPLLLLLPYFSAPAVFGGGESGSGWQTLHGSDVLMLLSSLAVVALLIVDVFIAPNRHLMAGVTALSFVTVGLAWPDFLGLPVGWDAGAYMVLVAALVSAGGATLALSEPPQVRAADNPFTAGPGTTSPPPSEASSPPAEADDGDAPAAATAPQRQDAADKTAT